jgi:hypothetical protein
MINQALKDKIEVEKLRREASALNLCPICGNCLEVKHIKEPVFEIKKIGFFIKKEVKVKIYDDEKHILICSSNNTHYEKDVSYKYVDYDADEWF